MAHEIFDKAVDAGQRLRDECDAAGSVLDDPRATVSPEAALARLTGGNARYVAGASRGADHAAGRVERAKGQAPFAALVSCADSRVAPEMAFDEPPGALFVCRLAGNLVNADVLASLEYAVTFLGTSLIVVLGHSGCGAVDAAIRVAETAEVLPGNLDQMAVSILPAVTRAQRAGHGDATALLDAVIAENARLSAQRITSRSATLAEAVEAGRLAVRAAVYEIASGEVRFID